MENNPFILIPGWVEKTKAIQLSNQLLSEVNWEQPKVKIFGKSYLVPRLTAFLASKEINYSYSGVKHIGKGWPDWFIPLLEKVKHFCKTDYNGCLLNLYRNGNDCMGWHADNEKELDLEKKIASLSLGATRDFYFRNIVNLKKECFSISNGDLLIMEPGCQETWVHSLPRRKMVNELRINLTFRRYI